MSHYNDQDRVIAFAGIYQAATLVHQLASQGQADTEALSATLNSLFVENPPDTLSVFGNLAGIKLGLRALRAQMSHTEAVNEKRNIYITQYVINMLTLEKKLGQDSQIEETLFRRLATPHAQSKHFGLLHDNTAAGLALIYTETLSQMRPKVLVQGAHHHLSQPLIANRIRACLLAGVRAARLWRQTGGSRWHLIFMRTRYLNAIDQTLAHHREQDRNEIH
jgi:high frequency lysogenization protein